MIGMSLKKKIALNILYVPHNTKEIEPAYKSNHNLGRESLAVKILSALLRGIISNRNGDLYC